MNSNYEAQDVPDAAQDEPTVFAAIKKIQRHLVFLEKKIDTLIEQSKGRSFNKSSHFSKPHKSHSHSHRSDSYGQKRGDTFGPKRRFDKPWRNDNRGNSRNKKRSFHGRQFGHGRNTDVIHG